MAFKRKIVLVLALGVLVIVFQIVALSVITSQPVAQLPFEKRDSAPSEKQVENSKTVKTPLEGVSRFAAARSHQLYSYIPSQFATSSQLVSDNIDCSVVWRNLNFVYEGCTNRDC